MSKANTQPMKKAKAAGKGANTQPTKKIAGSGGYNTQPAKKIKGGGFDTQPMKKTTSAPKKNRSFASFLGMGK